MRGLRWGGVGYRGDRGGGAAGEGRRRRAGNPAAGDASEGPGFLWRRRPRPELAGQPPPERRQ